MLWEVFVPTVHLWPWLRLGRSHPPRGQVLSLHQTGLPDLVAHSESHSPRERDGLLRPERQLGLCADT